MQHDPDSQHTSQVLDQYSPKTSLQLCKAEQWLGICHDSFLTLYGQLCTSDQTTDTTLTLYHHLALPYAQVCPNHRF